jgi:hypothetical protein
MKYAGRRAIYGNIETIICRVYFVSSFLILRYITLKMGDIIGYRIE